MSGGATAGDAYIQALAVVKELLDAGGVGRLGQGGDNQEESGGRVHIDCYCLWLEDGWWRSWQSEFGPASRSCIIYHLTSRMLPLRTPATGPENTTRHTKTALQYLHHRNKGLPSCLPGQSPTCSAWPLI
jgi:hypothetical protein